MSKVESRKFCSVALKSPNGLILVIQKEVTATEATNNGPREFKKWVPDPEKGVALGAPPDANGSIRLRGYGGAAFGIAQMFRIAGGYAITNGVPVDFIDAWVEQNKEHEIVKRRLIHVGATENEVAARAKEHKDVWDGLNPLKMPRGDTERKSKDPRVPKRVGKGDRYSDEVPDDEVLRKPEFDKEATA